MGFQLNRRLAFRGGGAFTPTDISGMTLWLDMNQEAFSNDDTIATATDWASTSNDFTQATGADKPIFKTGIINGLPAMLFDGSSDFLSNTTYDPFAGVDQSYSIFVVYQPVTITQTQSFVNKTLGSAPWTGQYFEIQSSKLSCTIDGGATGTNVSPSTTLVNGTAYILSFVRDGGVTGKARVDGSAMASGADTESNNVSVANDFFIGKGEGFCAGYIAQVLIYDSALSDEDRGSLLTYLGDMYSITVP